MNSNTKEHLSNQLRQDILSDEKILSINNILEEPQRETHTIKDELSDESSNWHWTALLVTAVIGLLTISKCAMQFNWLDPYIYIYFCSVSVYIHVVFIYFFWEMPVDVWSWCFRLCCPFTIKAKSNKSDHKDSKVKRHQPTRTRIPQKSQKSFGYKIPFIFAISTFSAGVDMYRRRWSALLTMKCQQLVTIFYIILIRNIYHIVAI